MSRTVFDHFWGVGLLVMGVNILIGRFRMRELIAEGSITAADANKFCLKTAIVLALVIGLFEVAQQVSGIPMHCRLSLPITDRAHFPFYAMTLLTGCAFLYWLWRRGGGIGPWHFSGPLFPEAR